MTHAKSVSHRWLILTLICTAEFMMVLDFSIMNVALPSIEQALGFSQQALQWVVTAFALPFGGLLLLGGRAADLFGKRRMFTLGLLLFTPASLIGGLAQSQAILITARVFQGIGAAIVSPSALSILLATFPEGKARNLALTIWGAMAAGGIAVGVILGGLLTHFLSWRWVLFVNIPVGIAALIATPFLLKGFRTHSAGYFDWLGGLTVTTGLFSLVYTLERLGSTGWRSNQALWGLGLALVLLVAFAWIEARSPAPLLPLAMFRRREIILGTLLGALMNAALGASVFILTLYMQNILQYTPLQSGLGYAPMALTAMLTAPLAPKLVSRFGTKYTLAGSITLVAVGLLALSRVPVDGQFVRDLMPGGISIGLGIVITQIAISITATRGVSSDEEGLVSGLLTTSQQLGSGLGLAVLVAVSALRTQAMNSGASQASNAALTAGYRAALLTGSIFAMIGVLVALFVIRSKKNHAHSH